MNLQSTDNNNNLDRQYLNLIENVNFHPIFIMGDHRSGTTLLYKILVATECFNFLNTYHLVKYDEILSNHVNQIETQVVQGLEELFKSLDIKNREFDQIEVSPNSPEEYGFFFKNFDYQPYINQNNLTLFIQLCKKIQLVSNQDRAILLKNPRCFSNFTYIKKAFPKAKFIFIHRNPIHVINSKLKALRYVLSNGNAYTAFISKQDRKILTNPIKRYFYSLLYSRYFNLGLGTILKKTVQSTNYFLDNIELLSSSDYTSVKYEDLCKSPEATIFKILEFLELEPTANLNYEQLIKPRPVNLLPEIERNYHKICQKLKPYLTYHDYSV